jgi:O-antigen ligase
MAELAVWLPAAFWVVYTLSNTVLSGPPALGPLTALNVLYILMLPAAARLVIRWRQVRPAGFIAYGLFMLWVAVGLLWRDPSSAIDVPKQILVYGLLGLGAAQAVARPRAAEMLARGCVVGAIILSAWTVWSALQSDFGFRAGTSVNPNFVATLIAPGLLVALVGYFNWPPSNMRRLTLAAVLFFFYALALLESRGALVALFAAVAIIWARAHARLRVAWPVLVGVVFVLFLGKVPAVVHCAAQPSDCFNEEQLARINGVTGRVRALVGRGAPPEVAAAAPEPVRPAGPELPAPAKPTAADAGVGAYGSDVRYYRVEWVQKEGDAIVRESPPGPAITFTPSGSGLAARVFRPVPPRAGETDWILEQSADGEEWNRMGRNGVPVAQESIDDSWAVSAYPTERRRMTIQGRLGDWSTAAVRLVLWRAAVTHLGSGVQPLVVGGGLGESQVVSHRANPVYNSMHNEFLQVALDFGLIGFALFAAIHWQILRGLWPRTDPTAAVFLAGTIFWLCTGLTGSTTDLHPYWLFLGVAAANAGNLARHMRVEAGGPARS